MGTVVHGPTSFVREVTYVENERMQATLAFRYNSAMAKSPGGWDGRRIEALRKQLGSATRDLSRGDLVRLVNGELSVKDQVTESSMRRWETENVEPPYAAAAVMARLAGVSYEMFTLGREAGEHGKGAPSQERRAAPPEPRTVRGRPVPPSPKREDKAG